MSNNSRQTVNDSRRETFLIEKYDDWYYLYDLEEDRYFECQYATSREFGNVIMRIKQEDKEIQQERFAAEWAAMEAQRLDSYYIRDRNNCDYEDD